MIGTHDVSVAQLYADFGEHEARGESDVYWSWSLAVSSDPRTCLLIDSLPKRLRQPNLVFAAARWHGCPDSADADLPLFLQQHWSAILPTLLRRRTQTNEAARCATLVPVLTRLPQPIALIEVGAAAGLCLLPDHYSYRYATGMGPVSLDPADGESAVVLECALEGIEAPTALPTVSWRAGIDLHPLDAADPDSRSWLETLVWPGQDARRERLRAALDVATREQPRLVAGDLLDELPGLVAEAPADATVVVFHTAVLAYLDADGRRRFRDMVDGLPVRWLSNESPMVFPDLGEPMAPKPAGAGQFVLALDGEPIGWAQAHGRSLCC